MESYPWGFSAGPPPAARSAAATRKTLAAEAALFDHAQELVENLVDRAKRGEPTAIRLVMETSPRPRTAATAQRIRGTTACGSLLFQRTVVVGRRDDFD